MSRFARRLYAAVIRDRSGVPAVLLQSFHPGAPWVAGLTLTDAEMGRNLLAGPRWS